MEARGIRNHNPLNIRRNGIKWKGLCSVQTDPSFFQFISDEYGFRAAFRILRTYSTRFQLTIWNVIVTWAPPNENDTENYVKFVSVYLGIHYRDKIDLSDKSLMCDLVRAMAKMETGKWYDREVVRAGYDLFLKT